MFRNIINLFENEEKENHYKPVRVSDIWSNNYIGYESNGDRKKTLLVQEDLNKSKPYLKETTNNLKIKFTEKINSSKQHYFFYS